MRAHHACILCLARDKVGQGARQGCPTTMHSVHHPLHHPARPSSTGASFKYRPTHSNKTEAIVQHKTLVQRVTSSCPMQCILGEAGVRL